MNGVNGDDDDDGGGGDGEVGGATARMDGDGEERLRQRDKLNRGRLGISRTSLSWRPSSGCPLISPSSSSATSRPVSVCSSLPRPTSAHTHTPTGTAIHAFDDVVATANKLLKIAKVHTVVSCPSRPSFHRAITDLGDPGGHHRAELQRYVLPLSMRSKLTNISDSSRSNSTRARPGNARSSSSRHHRQDSLLNDDPRSQRATESAQHQVCYPLRH